MFLAKIEAIEPPKCLVVQQREQPVVHLYAKCRRWRRERRRLIREGAWKTGHHLGSPSGKEMDNNSVSK